MPKLILLKTEQDFSQFRQSKSFQTRLIRIRVIPGRNQNTPRFGFIVPKKVLPKAVHRNLIKRRIKSFLIRGLVRIKPADVLIFPGAELLKRNSQDLDTELAAVFTKANLWK